MFKIIIIINPKGKEGVIFKNLIVLTKVVSIGIGTMNKTGHLITIHLDWCIGVSCLLLINPH
jgi:hypothetical protein